MTKAYDSVQVVIGVSTGDVENEGTAEIVAELNAEDNGSPSDYIEGTQYFVRLYKGASIQSVISFSNFGGVGISQRNVSEDVEDELIAFTGSATASLNKMLWGDITLTPVGIVYTKNGVVVTPTIIKTQGNRTLTADQEIWGIYLASYKTQWDKYWFNANRQGTMLIVFVGDTEA